MKLDETLAQPLYKQLVHDLTDKIQSGDLAEGIKLPSEQEISELYGVSRITVRTALKELASEGLIISKQGKGTFVGKKKMTRNLSLATSFTQACREMGRVPGAQVLRLGLETADEDDVKELLINPKDQVVVLERIRFADNVPISYEIDRFPQKYSFLLDEDLTNTSLLQLLDSKYNIAFENVHRSIELVYANLKVARLLNLHVNYPLLYVASAGNEANSGRPGQRSLQYIVGDKFKFYL